MAQHLKGRTALMREFPEVRKRYWGRHLWSKEYFCR
ncbi:MAG: transposase [Holosporaceae bacterium]|nr:transposase [Holosporaceae bacterium]